MENIYYDTGKVGSLGGVSALTNSSKKRKNSVEKWLQSQDAFTLHRPVRRKFQRRTTFVPGPDHLWQIDLVDVSSITSENEGNKFILTVIDAFSRFALAALPIKNKSAVTVKDAFANLLHSQIRRPSYVQSDKGKEFLNSVFQEYLKSEKIKFYTSENDDVKCAIVESFHRNLKAKMWRWFTYSNSHRYLDILQNVINVYNSTVHSAIKMAPRDVTPQNFMKVATILYPQHYKKSKRAKFHFELGDTVRISKSKQIFKKGYVAGWSEELFKISKRIPTIPPTYKLQDLSAEDIVGKFYKEELQKVIKDNKKDTYKIEKILKTRTVKGSKQYFVRWQGYSSKFDSWIDDIYKL